MILIKNMSAAAFVMEPDTVRAIQCVYSDIDMRTVDDFLEGDDNDDIVTPVSSTSTRKTKRRSYTFKTVDPSIKVGDYVVAESRSGYAIIEVVDVDVMPPIEDESTTFRWIVCKIDMAAHVELLRNEAAMIDGLRNAQRALSAQLMGKALREALGDKVDNIPRIMSPKPVDSDVSS